MNPAVRRPSARHALHAFLAVKLLCSPSPSDRITAPILRQFSVSGKLFKIFRSSVPGSGPLLIIFYLFQPLILHQSHNFVLLKLLLDRPNCPKFSGAERPLSPPAGSWPPPEKNNNKNESTFQFNHFKKTSVLPACVSRHLRVQKLQHFREGGCAPDPAI